MLTGIVPPAATDAVFGVPVGGVAQRVEMTGGTGRVGVPAGTTVEIDPNGRVLFEPVR